MASISDGVPPKQQLSAAVPSSGDNNNGPQPPLAPPQAASNHTDAASRLAHPPSPHTMGYPPVMGFPQAEHGQYPYPQHYPGYSNGEARGYHCPQPQADPYNPTAHPHRSSISSGFFRGFILCSCLIVVGIFAANLLMYLVLRPQFPVYKMDSFSVSNFNATNSIFSANWDAKVTIENPNSKLEAYFANFEVQIFWKHNSLAMIEYDSAFDIGKKQNRQMDVKLSANSSNQMVMVNGTAEEMAKERHSTGSVNFAVKMSTVTAFRPGSFWTRGREIAAVCEDLKVQFQGSSSDGTWNNGGNSMDCLHV